MRYILIIIWFLAFVILALTTYADFWEKNRCDKAGGNWISMNYGKYCVDKDLKESEWIPAGESSG